jgi:metal-dependent hydrolase (beta-lactamase superfamily II)
MLEPTLAIFDGFSMFLSTADDEVLFDLGKRSDLTNEAARKLAYREFEEACGQVLGLADVRS